MVVKRLFLRWLMLAGAIFLAAQLLPSGMIAITGGLRTMLLAAIVLSIANVFIRPILMIVSLPLTIITLGLFAFVINAGMMYIVAYLVPGFVVKNFLGALLASIAISIFNGVLSMVIRD